jgi:hypothetical protein
VITALPTAHEIAQLRKKDPPAYNVDVSDLRIVENAGQETYGWPAAEEQRP